MFFSKVIYFFSPGSGPGSGSKLCQIPGFGSKFNVFGSTTLVGSNAHLEHNVDLLKLPDNGNEKAEQGKLRPVLEDPQEG